MYRSKLPQFRMISRKRGFGVRPITASRSYLLAKNSPRLPHAPRRKEAAQVRLYRALAESTLACPTVMTSDG